MAEFEQRDSLARRFHETYERLAPDFGYKTREASAVPWEDVPQANKELMRAVAGEIIDHAVSVTQPSDDEVKAAAYAMYSAECHRLGIGPVVPMHASGWSEGRWCRRARAALEAARGVKPTGNPGEALTFEQYAEGKQ